MLRRLFIAGLVLYATPDLAQEVDYASAQALFGEPVTVSATGKPQRASDAPANMEIITADQIRRSGASNIPDVLQFVTGLNVRRYGQLDAAVGVRGYNTALNPRVLVLVDGRQVSQDDLGFTPWALIPVPMSSIRQIEIIKGPNAALYGFNAVSGVINIVTYDPLFHRQNTLDVRAGTQSRRDVSGVGTLQKSDRWGVRLSAHAIHADPFEARDGNGDSLKPEVKTAALDMAYRVSPDVTWRLSGSLGFLDSPYYSDVGYYAQLSDDVYSLRTRLTADTRFGLIAFDAYHNGADLSLPFAGFALTEQPSTTVVKLNDLFRLNPENTVRIGAEWRRTQARSARVLRGQFSESIVAGSLMWDWQITPRLSWTNSVRVDALWLHHDGPQFNVAGQGSLFHDHEIVAPSFNTGLVFKADDNNTWRALVGRAYRLPSVADFGFALDVGGAQVVGDPRLDPSKVTNYEIDYERRVAAAASRVKLAVFARSTARPISSPFGSPPRILPSGEMLIQARNLQDSDQYGVELSLSGAARGYRWKAGYAANFINDKTPSQILDQASSAGFERQTPVSSVVLALGRAWQRLSIDVQANWQSSYYDYGLVPGGFTGSPVPIDDYWIADARIGYRLTDQATVSLTGEQLNAGRLSRNAGHRVPRQVTLGLNVNF